MTTFWTQHVFINITDSEAPDAYGQSIANGQATVSLASNILQFGQPLAQAFLKDRADRKVGAATKRRLQKYMGPWYAVLMEEDKLERQPVLKVEAFREWMFKNDGAFQPSGKCDATADWAILLYALNIGPDTQVQYNKSGRMVTESVVSYKPIGTARNTASTSSGLLEIPGEVACHILNLFGEVSLKGEWCDAYTLFGLFGWAETTSKDGISNFKFAQSDIESVGCARQPFGMLGELMEPGTRVALYFQTIDRIYNLYASCGALMWPDPKKPLSVRLKALRNNFLYVEDWQDYHDPVYRAEMEKYWQATALTAGNVAPKPDPPKAPRECNTALVLSEQWLKEADRVLRRATTNGGEGRVFLEDIYQTLAAYSTDPRHEEAKVIVRNRCVFDQDMGFRFEILEDSDYNLSNKYVFSDPLVRELIHSTILGYKDSKDPWKSQIYAAEEDMEWLMRHDREVKFDPRLVHVIPMTTCPGSTLWTSTVYLQ